MVKNEKSDDDTASDDGGLKVDKGLSDESGGEKAVYEHGKGIKILDNNEDDLRNIDDVLNERCGIPKPKYR